MNNVDQMNIPIFIVSPPAMPEGCFAVWYIEPGVSCETALDENFDSGDVRFSHWSGSCYYLQA